MDSLWRLQQSRIDLDPSRIGRYFNSEISTGPSVLSNLICKVLPSLGDGFYLHLLIFLFPKINSIVLHPGIHAVRESLSSRHMYLGYQGIGQSTFFTFTH